MSALVSLKGVSKTYTRGKQAVPVLDKLDLDIAQGDFLALMGPSGSGKTTLLNLIGGLDRPTAGTIVVDGEPIERMSSGALARWRAANVGFVFQFYNLMPVLTAYENVELPLMLTGLTRAERRERVELVLAAVGLADRMEHYPNELSGGQQQRVAIARAVVADPRIIVADEPTGDLDRHAAAEVLGMLQRLNRDLGKTIIMVTHDANAARAAKAMVHLEKGELLPA